MRLTDEGHIDLGDGGLILNTEANEKLLRQLQETPPLSQAQLLKLAKFFKGFPTQVSLGNHLALLALTKPDMQKDVFSEYADALGGIIQEILEDIRDQYGDEGSRDVGLLSSAKAENAAGQLFAKAEPTISFIQLSARWIRVSGIGLYIESVDYAKNDSVKRIDFVVGVSPNPDKLAV